MMPITGRQSTIDNPLSVNRVIPPTTTMLNMVKQTATSHMMTTLLVLGIGLPDGQDLMRRFYIDTCLCTTLGSNPDQSFIGNIAGD